MNPFLSYRASRPPFLIPEANHSTCTGRFLGRGAVGDVHEVTLQGQKLAHKRILFRRKIGEKDKKEIEILKKLSHVHVIQLIGTYTQQKFLGIILYPVAECDLHTFFEDVEAWMAINQSTSDRQARLSELEPSQKRRLEALGYDFPEKKTCRIALPIYSKIGCLISAVAYLHSQKVRHKDLKPSNILLSKDRIWISDFGSATDFTLLSHSATNNERGTPRYFAPEMAAWEVSGRAADMFSLGCILLEILVLHQTGSLDHIRENRSLDPSFHANLDKLKIWTDGCKPQSSRKRKLMLWEIENMLSIDPEERPNAEELLCSIIGSDSVNNDTAPLDGVFGHCCKDSVFVREDYAGKTKVMKSTIKYLEDELRRCQQAERLQSSRVEEMRQASQQEAKTWAGHQVRVYDAPAMTFIY